MGCMPSVIHQEGSAMKFTPQFCRIIKRYLPHFEFDDPSTTTDRLVAFAHWSKAYKDTPKTIDLAVNSAVGKLYEKFYEYLFDNSPQLKPLFQSSHHVQGRVLVHISAGMQTLLKSDDLVTKVMELAILHMKIGVKPEDFDSLGVALVHAMKATSGTEWNDRVEHAWRRIFCHIHLDPR
ncbi:hypothetical protein Poli38472_006066 [Pythium oligandrum]|uniref:Globin domain-containing protein n=1 Tax=Pythium oligandrum TaxID=41045 RepID=A0A8K1CTE6_PYTOL|nr:hypothetical protein Poli38472_006066 [Pythium oligandrum]|eukprot:TMW68598.1 hypothetical protein Poli38472_006066 [Pythium oligandrum]